MGMVPTVGSSCDADEESVMTAGAGAEVGTGAGSASGSDIELGVADSLHPTSARIVRKPSKSEATEPEMLFSPLFSSL